MEMSSGQQRLLFVVVVLLLAGLGIYLLGPARERGAAAAPPTPSPSPASAAPATTASAAPTRVPPSTVPPYTPPATKPASAGGADIYRWLPFSQQDLANAAQTTVAFAGYYDTFSYTETPPVYAKKMAGVVTSDLDAALENGYATLDVAAQRSAQKQVSSSSGAIDSISSFGSGSITFIVGITQKLATTKGTKTSTSQYDITVVANAGGWWVANIEVAGVGDQ
jgi:hypothetical protein